MNKLHILLIQKLLGILFLLFSVLIVAITPEEGTVLFFTIPAGIILLVARKQILE